MARPNFRFIHDFRGGLNTEAGILGLERNESPDLSNVEFSKFGHLMKINGYTMFNGSTPIPGSPTIEGIYNFVTSDGTQRRLVAANGKIYQLSDAGVFTEVYSGLTAGHRVYFSTFADLCIITNGVDDPLEYNGSSFNTLSGFSAGVGGSDKPKYSAVWKNRLWLAAGTKNYRLYHSVAGSSSDWLEANGANNIDVDINDGLEITGIATFGDHLIIHKKTVDADRSGGKILYVSGDSKAEFAIHPINTSASAVAQNAIVTIGPSIQLFLDVNGVYSLTSGQFSDQFKIENVSTKIQSVIADINLFKLEEAFAIDHKKKSQAWFFFPEGASVKNNKCVFVDYETGAWSVREGFKASVGLEEDGYPMLGDYEGNVQKHDNGGSFNGNAIASYYYTYWETFGTSTLTKRIRSVDFTVAESGNHNLTVEGFLNYQYQNFASSHSISLNYASGIALWDVAMWDVGQWSEPQNKIVRKISGFGNCKSLQLKLSNNGANQPWTCYGIDYTYLGRGFRYGQPFP